MIETAAGLADLGTRPGYGSLIAMLIEEDLLQLEVDPEVRKVVVRVFRSAALLATKTVCLTVGKAKRQIDWEAVGEIAEGELGSIERLRKKLPIRR